MLIFAVGALMLGGSQAVAQPIEATTATGEKVLLHPNGRWEYVDQKKAAEARKIAERYPENQGCPPGSQGGLFGIGRCIMPGDKDYNRGTLNPGRR
ncbi:MAG: hypothetical protein HYU76_00560 [Betaproteobacteria bacterium]|nr:hypothetical protein [Betaproteobacteria bacterium]